jgi:nicotinamidase-related amidase
MIALVLIDLQVGITALVPPGLLAPTVARAADLAAGFRSRQRPVILVRVAFSPDGGDVPRNRTDAPRAAGRPPANWTEPLPELGAQPTDLVVTKHQPGAFHGTDLDLQLRRRGITDVVLGGIATSLGVESTARAAYDHGYHVSFAADAMADPDLGAHEHSLRVTFPKFGHVTTTQALLAAEKVG